MKAIYFSVATLLAASAYAAPKVYQEYTQTEESTAPDAFAAKYAAKYAANSYQAPTDAYLNPYYKNYAPQYAEESADNWQIGADATENYEDTPADWSTDGLPSEEDFGASFETDADAPIAQEPKVYGQYSTGADAPSAEYEEVTPAAPGVPITDGPEDEETFEEDPRPPVPAYKGTADWSADGLPSEEDFGASFETGADAPYSEDPTAEDGQDATGAGPNAGTAGSYFD